MQIEISELAVLLAAKQQAQPETPCPWCVGKNYFIRTVTHHLTGRLVQVTPQELALEDAAWIADDGRLADSLKSGEFSEIEPFPAGLVIVGRGSIIDACAIATPLPRQQK